jgi:hypothetical protein
MIQLVMAYRHRGWRWPFRDGDAVEVWTPAHELLVIIPAELLRATVDHLIKGQRLQEAFARLPRAVESPRRPLAMAKPTRRLKGYAG